MRLHRFYLKDPIKEDKFDISDKELIHQWRNVFRYNVGSQVILFDGGGFDYLVMITSLRSQGATVEVIEKKNNLNTVKMNLWLCVSLIKKDNFDLVVQKATELGVSHIIPVLCERSEKKDLKLERLRKIATEASEQSGREGVPKIYNIVELENLLNLELIEDNVLPKNKIVLHIDGKYIGDFLAKNSIKDLMVFIGPEGGWSGKEIKSFSDNGIPSISLSTQILRAETASIAVSSLLLL